MNHSTTPRIDGRRFLRRAVAILLLLIAGGFVVDSYRLASHARHQWELADQDMQKIEGRLGALLRDRRSTPAVERAWEAYDQAATPDARRLAYEQLAGAFHSTVSSEIDATHPLERRFMDEAAGLMNRHDVAQAAYEGIAQDYQAALSGVRGAIARWCSAQFRADWQAPAR